MSNLPMNVVTSSKVIQDLRSHLVVDLCVSLHSIAQLKPSRLSASRTLRAEFSANAV